MKTGIEAEAEADYERARARAHSTAQWGQYEILIYYCEPCLAETFGGRAVRLPAYWYALAWHGHRHRVGRERLRHKTKRAALTYLRKEMRERRERIPRQLESLEQELERLKEALG
jgi:hypothetical protein